MRLFGGPRWQETLAAAAKRAQARATQLQNDFAKGWVEVSSVAGVAAATALLNAPSRKALAAALTDVSADRLLAVLAAEFAELFTSNADNLSVMKSCGVVDASIFARDVLGCFDPYGSAVFEVAKSIRVTGDERWATHRTFALDRHIAIAVLAPAEARAFADIREAFLAGHHSVSKLEDSIVTSNDAIAVYENKLIPEIERRLKADRARARAVRDALWQHYQRMGVNDAAREVWAPFESEALDAALSFLKRSHGAPIDGALHSGAMRSTETETEVRYRDWNAVFEYLAFAYMAVRYPRRIVGWRA